MDNRFFEVDTDNVEELEFDAIKFVDVMRLAKKTWSEGYGFDVDPLVIQDAVPNAPTKVLMRSMLPAQKGKPSVYRLWVAVTVSSVDYAVPIPVHVFVKDYEEHVFRWGVLEPANKVDLDRYVANVEASEEQMWADFLD